MKALNNYIILKKEEEVKETQSKNLIMPDVIKNKLNIAKVYNVPTDCKIASVGDLVVFDDSDPKNIIKFQFERQEFLAIKVDKIIANLNSN